jgi:DDE family transposase
VTPEGVLTGVGVAPGNAKDQPVADTFFAARHTPPLRTRLPEVGQPLADGVYLADTGFEGRVWQAKWDHVDAATLICRPKVRDQRSKRPWTAAERRSFAGLRQIVETVHARLLDTFGLDRWRPHGLLGLRAHLAAKVAAFNVACWLNLTWGRPLMAFADLIDW